MEQGGPPKGVELVTRGGGQGDLGQGHLVRRGVGKGVPKIATAFCKYRGLSLQDFGALHFLEKTVRNRGRS